MIGVFVSLEYFPFLSLLGADTDSHVSAHWRLGWFQPDLYATIKFVLLYPWQEVS